MNVDAEMAIYSDAGSNPAISIYNLFKSVDRCLKYQYINTFLFPSAAIRQSIQQAFSSGDACFIYIKKTLSSWLFTSCLEHC